MRNFFLVFLILCFTSICEARQFGVCPCDAQTMANMRVSNIKFEPTIPNVDQSGIAKRLMPLGDSITRGVGDSSTIYGYRDHLQTLLGVGAYNFVGSFTDPDASGSFDVDHSGVGGNRCSQVEARVLAELQAHMPAGTNGTKSVVLLMCGTNEVDNDCATGNCSQAEIDAYVQNVLDTINIIDTHDSNIQVIVAKIIYKHVATGNADWIQFNDALAVMVAARDNTKANLFIVDQATPFENISNCSPNRDACLNDEVHPNNTGYNLMDNVWYDEIIQHD